MLISTVKRRSRSLLKRKQVFERRSIKCRKWDIFQCQKDGRSTLNHSRISINLGASWGWKRNTTAKTLYWFAVVLTFITCLYAPIFTIEERIKQKFGRSESCGNPLGWWSIYYRWVFHCRQLRWWIYSLEDWRRFGYFVWQYLVWTVCRMVSE